MKTVHLSNLLMDGNMQNIPRQHEHLRYLTNYTIQLVLNIGYN